MPFEHDGLHHTSAHRNKENCQFIAEEENTELKYKEIIDGKEQIKLFKPGDSAVPIDCLSDCKIKSRGHTHLLKCKGG